MDGVAETLEAVSVGRLVIFRRDRESFVEADISLVIVLKADDQKVLFRKCIDMDHALPVVFYLFLTLDRIVQGIAEDGADVHDIHEIEQ